MGISSWQRYFKNDGFFSNQFMILISKYLVPRGYVGMTLFPFDILKKRSLKDDVFLVNHENIHLKQQIELLVIPFFLWYGIEFLVRLVQYQQCQLAYRNISFEREAYVNEHDLEYFRRRRFWGFLRYL
jgi:hypothetical protein